MSLLCSAGLHQPEHLPRWNKGYYFSRCRRCRRDLVRSAAGGWFVPQGYRVVWLAEPPAWAEPAQLVAAAMPARRGWAERIGAVGRVNLERWRAAAGRSDSDRILPISDVLRALEARREEDGAVTLEQPDTDEAEIGASTPWDAPAEAPAVAEPVMESAPPADAAVDMAVAEALPAEDAPEPADDDDALPPASPGRASEFAGRWTLIGIALLALATLAAVVIAVLSNGGPAPVRDSGRQAAAAPETAFVNARIVNCRASPVDRAASVRKLPRGASVSVLAREDGWTSVSHRSRQCWIASRYLSHEAPL